MQTTTQTRFFSLTLAAVLTLGMLGGVDALARSGQSSDALLAQQGPLPASGTAPSASI